MLQTIGYYEAMVNADPLFEYKIVRPSEFLAMDARDYNVLVYQTFPDSTNKGKFNIEVIKQLDAAFLKFKGFKILLDSFDMGGYNGYERFGTDYPRIKHVPNYNYLKRFDVVSILCTTGWDQKRFLASNLCQKRNIPIHCAFTVGAYPHRRREHIMKILQDDFLEHTSFERVPVYEYGRFLQRVNVSVVAGGFGETSGSAYPALQSGALLFAHEKINDVKLFPFVDLVDNVDYASFNLENFSEKLDWVLSDSRRRNEIALSGQSKFFKGFDPERSAKEFLEYLQIRLEEL
jgi:hypothetical protein